MTIDQCIPGGGGLVGIIISISKYLHRLVGGGPLTSAYLVAVDSAGAGGRLEDDGSSK